MTLLTYKKYLLIILIIFTTTNIFSNDIDLTLKEKEYLINNPILKTINLLDYPPFNFNKNGEAKGYTIDYVKLMEKKMGIKIDFISGRPWNTYLKMLKSGEIDFIPHIAITESRSEYVDYTNFTHIAYSIGLAVQKSLNIEDINELNGKKIALKKNTFLHEHIKSNFPKIKFLFVNNNEEALDAILTNKASAAIGSLPALDYYINKNWLTNIKTFEVSNLGIPSRTNLPMGVLKGNDVLKSILEKVYNSIDHIEEVKIKEKWINSVEGYIHNHILTKDEQRYLQSKKEIKMCIDPDWMPFEKNQNGKHVGMSAEYIDLLEKQIKIPITFVPTKTWVETLAFSKNRRCDIISLAMPTEERKKFLDFTKAYLSTPFIIATSMDTFFINDISSVLDKKIGIVKGYAYYEILKDEYPNINLIEVDNIKEGLNKVKNGDLFGFVGSLTTIAHSIQKDYISEVKIAGKFKDSWHLSIGVRNDEPILTNIFNKAIDTISEKKRQEILNKWISVKYQKGVDYTVLIQVITGFALIFMFVLYKSQKMKLLNEKLLIANDEIKDQQDMVNKYVPMVSTDLDGIITEVNEAYCKVTGYTKEDLLDNSHSIMRHPDMSKKFFLSMWKSIEKNEIWTGEIKNFTKNNDICWLNTHVEGIFKEDIKIGYRSFCENITDKKRIEELSITDKLTGLYNRLKLDEIMNAQIEEFKRYKNPFSVILLDVDNFKKVNDVYGHDVGDYVLEELATRLKLNIRASDVIGRWGGEEFLVICKNSDVQNGYIVAEHLRDLIKTIPFDTIGFKTISLGITDFKEDDTPISLFKRVDDALYRAKNSGKNKTVLI